MSTRLSCWKWIFFLIFDWTHHVIYLSVLTVLIVVDEPPRVCFLVQTTSWFDECKIHIPEYISEYIYIYILFFSLEWKTNNNNQIEQWPTHWRNVRQHPMVRPNFRPHHHRIYAFASSWNHNNDDRLLAMRMRHGLRYQTRTTPRPAMMSSDKMIINRRRIVPFASVRWRINASPTRVCINSVSAASWNGARYVSMLSVVLIMWGNQFRTLRTICTRTVIIYCRVAKCV